MLCASAGAADSVCLPDVSVLADRRGVWEKRHTVSPYRFPAIVALRSARISPDLASSVALDL